MKTSNTQKNSILFKMKDFQQEWMKNEYAIQILNEWRKDNYFKKKNNLNHLVFPTFLFNYIHKNLWDNKCKEIIYTLLERYIASGTCECDIKYIYMDKNADELCHECEKRQHLWFHRKSPETIQQLNELQKDVIEWMNNPERNLIKDKPFEIRKRLKQIKENILTLQN